VRGAVPIFYLEATANGVRPVNSGQRILSAVFIFHKAFVSIENQGQVNYFAAEKERERKGTCEKTFPGYLTN